MPSKYVDTTSIIQIIGCVYNNPQLLNETDKYVITDEDFPDDFHRTIFGTLYKLYELGAVNITLESVSDFLSSRKNKEALYKQNKGEEFLLRASEAARQSTFNYYYSRLKKFTLLRAYDNFGLDVSFLYDINNILDVKKKQLQEDWLDNNPIDKIADEIDKHIDEIRFKYVDDMQDEAIQAGEGIQDLIQNLKANPEAGAPLFGPLINTISRGARVKKFYLRSAPTGVGKTRTMIADACYLACDKYYDERFGWIKNGKKLPTLYIATEQDLEEVQTMMLAFLSNVDEDHILTGKYFEGEEDRVIEAGKIIQESPLFIERLPDFSLQDIEDTIKKNIREHEIIYVFHDYIHTSLKILEEITRKSGGVKLREDNILYMLSVRLKDLCNKYGVFILSATQLNGDYQDSKTPDQNLLRGAKAIADKIDLGMILLPVKDEDLVKLEPILSVGTFQIPTIKMSVYKNRRGKYKGVLLWCKAELSTCRVEPMFMTDYSYEIIPIEDAKIILEEESAF